MPRARRVNLIPTTPSGAHLRTSDLSVDEIEIDDEIVVKSSVFRRESDAKKYKSLEPQSKFVKRTPKYIVRKSTDFKKIKDTDVWIEALLASPMIENRRRPSGHSKSLEIEAHKRTPIRVPSSRDLQAVSSRQMSAILMSKFASFLHSSSFTEGEQRDMDPVKLTRRRTTGNLGTPSYSSKMNLSASLKKNTPVTPALRDVPHMGSELIALGEQKDSENLPPSESSVEKVQSDPENVVLNEPTSVGEFRVLVNLEISRLSASKAAWEDVMEEERASIPEAALNSIRSAVGKCSLLIENRLKTFFGLIDHTEESLRRQEQGDVAELTPHQRSSINDLLGMWANIAQQISDIDKSFERLRRWRDTAKWAYDSPPATPAAPENNKSDRVSRVPRPLKPKVQKFKGSFKPILSPVPRATDLKLRPPKIARRSNLAHIRAQMLARKKALEADGNHTGIVTFGGQRVVNKRLCTPTVRDKSSETVRAPEPSGSRISTPTPQSARRGRPPKSSGIVLNCEESVDLPSPVYESSRNLFDVEITSGGKVALSKVIEAGPEPAENSTVHKTSDLHQDGESDLIEKNLKVQSRKRGRPRKSDARVSSPMIQDFEPKLVEQSVVFRSPKRGRPRKSTVSVFDSQYSISVDEDEIADVKPAKRGRPQESVVEAVSPRRNSGSEFVEERKEMQSPKRRESRKSMVPAPTTPDNVNDIDVDESTVTQFAERGRIRESSPFMLNSQPQLVSTDVAETPAFQSPRRGRPRKSLFAQSKLANLIDIVQTPRRGRPKKSAESQALIVDADAVGTTPVVISRRGRSRRSVVQATSEVPPPSFTSVVNSAPRSSTETSTVTPRRGRPPKVSIFSEVDVTNVSENAASTTPDGNFLIPDSLPRKRIRMDHSLLSNSHASGLSITPNPFSPPPRPATGTPRPHMSQLMSTKINSSLSQSVLRKQLMLATTCGGNNSGRSSATQLHSDKRPLGRPRKSTRFLASPDASDPDRRVPQRARYQRSSP